MPCFPLVESSLESSIGSRRGRRRPWATYAHVSLAIWGVKCTSIWAKSRSEVCGRLRPIVTRQTAFLTARGLRHRLHSSRELDLERNHAELELAGGAKSAISGHCRRYGSGRCRLRCRRHSRHSGHANRERHAVPSNVHSCRTNAPTFAAAIEYPHANRDSHANQQPNRVSSRGSRHRNSGYGLGPRRSDKIGSDCGCSIAGPY
jgi:hypothetical protein